MMPASAVARVDVPLLMRAMTEADLPAVLAVERVIYPFPWSEGNFRDSLLCGDRAWIWEAGHELAGYGVVNQVLDEAQILNIGIAKDRQGQGRGRTLLDFLCNDARQHGAIRMFLEVRPSNEAARALYDRAGFQIIGQRRGYYPATDGREDAIVMELLL